MRKYTRRDFVRMVGAGAASLSILALTGGCEAIRPYVANRPVRRNLATLDPGDPVLQTYKDAISAMKALPATDGRNWIKQSDIHRDWCAHQNWWFFPWHRAYLHHFEEICRELTGDDTFALPYWDWTTIRGVPPAFEGDASNPLFLDGRTAPDFSRWDEFVAPSVLERSLGNASFTLFSGWPSANLDHLQRFIGGSLEGGAHNYIHRFVGGLMGDPATAGQDPLFWTHHAMVEFCWVEWNINRGNPNINDAAWNDYVFAGNFVNRMGDPIDVPLSSLLFLPLTSYQYEASGIGGGLGVDEPGDLAELQRFLTEGAAVELVIDAQVAVQEQLEVREAQPVSVTLPVGTDGLSGLMGAGPGGDERLLLTVGNVVPPPDNDFFVRVFVNHPEVTAQTPIEDPHYAGSFAFFVSSGHDHGTEGQPGFVVDITDTVQQLSQGGDVSGDVTVQLVAVPLTDRELTSNGFRFDFLELAAARHVVSG